MYKYKPQLQYAPDSAAGGASPSLSDLDKTDQSGGTGIEGGDGNPKPADLATAAVQQVQQQNEPVEGLKPDGTLQEGYEKNDKGEIVRKGTDDPKDTEEGEGGKDKESDGQEEGDDTTEEGSEDTPEAFFHDVDALRGEEIQVDYPDGMDPLSPEGVYHREKFLEQRAIEKFDEHLRKTDPRAYAYWLHRQSGGSDDDFFADKSFSLPDYEEFKANADLQLRVYKSDLLSRGLDAESVQILADKAVKDGKVFELADAAYRGAESRNQKELEELDRKNQQAQAAYQNSVQALDQTLVQTVNEGKGLNLVIPDADKKDFLQFVRGTLEYDQNTGKFLIVQPVDGDISRQIEALYLLHKKGDLKALIQREAKSQNAKRLIRIIQKSKTTEAPKTGQQPPARQASVPLGEL